MRDLIRISVAMLAIAAVFPTASAAQKAQQSRGSFRAQTSLTTAMAKLIEIQANPRGFGQASAAPPNPASAASPVPPAMPADPNYHGGPYVGALTPPPLQAMHKIYPVCSKIVQDSCINPNERKASQIL